MICFPKVLITICHPFLHHYACTNYFDTEKNKSYKATIEEVIKNDFVLSVSAFVQDDIVKIEYDPIELQKNARNGMLRRIKSDIELDKMICEIEGYNFIEYLISIENLIKSYYE